MTSEIVNAPSASDLTAAESVGVQIEICLNALSSAEEEFDSNYARLGGLLDKVKTQKLWLLPGWAGSSEGFKSFGSYLKQIEPRVKKGRSQIYAIIGVSEELSPLVSEADLATIGISKASELRKVLKAGKTITKAMITSALDPRMTAQELKASIFEAAHIYVPESEPEKYFDMKGFYATVEERREIERATDVAIKVIGIKDDVPEHTRWKAVILAWVAEFLCAYEAQVQQES